MVALGTPGAKRWVSPHLPHPAAKEKGQREALSRKRAVLPEPREGNSWPESC